jgi:hypothetical protein
MSPRRLLPGAVNFPTVFRRMCTVPVSTLGYSLTYSRLQTLERRFLQFPAGTSVSSFPFYVELALTIFTQNLLHFDTVALKAPQKNAREAFPRMTLPTLASLVRSNALLSLLPFLHSLSQLNAHSSIPSTLHTLPHTLFTSPLPTPFNPTHLWLSPELPLVAPPPSLVRPVVLVESWR